MIVCWSAVRFIVFRIRLLPGEVNRKLRVPLRPARRHQEEHQPHEEHREGKDHVHPQPEVQIRGDQSATYEGVGKILYACQRAGIVKVAFITEP